MAGLVVTTAPTGETLTETEIRNYLRVDDVNELSTLQMLRVAARKFFEKYTGRSVLTQVLTLYIDNAHETSDPVYNGFYDKPDMNFYKNYIVLPSPPVQSVAHVKTYDDDDTATTMAASKYYLDSVRDPARIILRTGETWPSSLRVANSIEVRYTAGYGAASAVPQDIKIGMLMHMAYMYDQRGDMKNYQETINLPPMVEQLYQPYKVLDGMGGSKFSAIG